VRVGTNLAKLRSCQHSHRVVLTGIETLGGNGAIESFSVLPRLLRDNVVYENWEGTHNVLVAQTLRDFARLGLHEGFMATLEGLLATGDAAVDQALSPARAALGRTREALGAILSHPDPGVGALMLRPHAEALADLLFAAGLGRDLATEPDGRRRAEELEALTLFAEANLAPQRPTRDAEYAVRVRRVAAIDD
jgi:hypothetical protein